MDRTSKTESAAPETSNPSPAIPAVPNGEIYVIHGQITDNQSGGGGYSFSPGYTNYLIVASDGRQEWLTLSTHRGSMNPCYACAISPPADRASCYGRGHWVLVSRLHDHYVIRALAEEFRH